MKSKKSCTILKAARPCTTTLSPLRYLYQEDEELKRLCETVHGAGFGARMKVTFLWRCNLRASLLRAGGLADRYYVKITPFSPPPTSLTISIAPHLARRPNLHLPRVRVRHVTFKYLTGLTFRRKLVSTDITLVVTRSLWSCDGNNGKSERVLGAICRSCYRCRRRWRRGGSWVDGVNEQGDVFPVHSQKYYMIRYR